MNISISIKQEFLRVILVVLFAIAGIDSRVHAYEVISLTLVNAKTDKDIRTLRNGDIINLVEVGASLSIRANTNPSVVGSVRFDYDGNKSYRTKNRTPYAISGARNGDYRSWTPSLGSHTLTATPYPRSNARGTPGIPHSVSLTVVGQSIEVTSLTLVNAKTDKDIRTLLDGDIINLAEVGRNLSIRANTNPNVVGSVRFSYDGNSSYRIQNWSPYANSGAKNGRYRSWTPSPGFHTLTATPYYRKNARGVAGTSYSINFTVVESGMTPFNRPPLANDDSATIAVDTEVTLDLLSNDHDDDGDPLRIIEVQAPSKGSVRHDDSEVIYVPDIGFTGVDRFEYTIGDDFGGTARAIVTINVIMENNDSSYGGDTVPGLTAIQPRITIPRTSGETPFSVHVSGMDTTAAGSAHPYDELEYSWNFGDASGNEIFTHPVTGELVNANADQKGPEAAYLFRNPGTYTITLTVRGWTGSAYVTATSAVQVDVRAWSGEDRYFDPVGGNDTNNGETAATAWKSWDKLSSWINGASNRGVFLKRGTTMLADSMIYLSKSHLRLRPYGSGSDPVIKASASMPSIIYLWANYGIKIDDQVFEGIVFNGNNGQANHCISAWYKGDGVAYLKDTAFINVTFVNDGNSRTLLNISGELGVLQRFMVWQSTFDHREGSTHGFFIALAKFAAVVGGSFSGGDGRLIMDHHIYPTGTPNALFRWIDFQQAISKNFCINTNSSKGAGITTRHVLIDGNNCTGTMNGLDFSNANNSSRGRFSDVIVQNNAIHDAGSIGGQGFGILGASVERIAIRDNLFYNNRLSDINITDSGVDLQSYRNHYD